jgi:predicted nucleic acid-binding protein
MLVAFARAHRPEEARRAITAMGITILSLTDAIAERAAALRARHSRLRLPEAIVLATAQEMGGSLLSYDRKLSRLAGKLT